MASDAAALPRLRAGRRREGAGERARSERSSRRVLATLVLSATGLVCLGLVMVLSASSISAFTHFGSSFVFFERHLLYVGLGTVLALGAARVRYRVWQRAWAPLLVVTVALLLLVLHPGVGATAGGAARWIEVGSFTFQPSELAKLVVVAAVAAILSRHLAELRSSLTWMVPVAAIVGAVTILILLQPDLGTASILAIAVFLMMFVAGVRLRFLVWSALLSGAMGMALIMGERYRRDRFFSFLDPWSDPQNAGYQIVQSLIALGSGQMFGVGLGASRQKWAYVPNAHTDFIFAILGEELGLVGEILVLALFGALVYAGVQIAMRAPDPFGRLLAAGITGWLGIQALINLGAVTGVLPITGVPLPFVSFGGSSLVVSLLAVGVLASIGRAGNGRQGATARAGNARTAASRRRAR